jgi:hypothetical protein
VSDFNFFHFFGGEKNFFFLVFQKKKIQFSLTSEPSQTNVCRRKRKERGSNKKVEKLD